MRPASSLAQLLVGEGRWPVTAIGWELLLAQARRASLSARLAQRLLGEDPQPPMPDGVRVLMQSALTVGQHVNATRPVEVQRACQALARRGVRCVLLKGAAYLQAGLPPAKWRVFGDIDLLVPKSELGTAEGALMGGGWISTDLGAYNQRYYREWMHEIPPLTHARRGSVIDLHHTITPPTSTFAVDGARLLAAIRPIAGGSGLWVLQPVDMVLHSAVHLFTEGEFDRALRDLLDMNDLLGHFEAHERGFWSDLVSRARELALQRPLYYALSNIERLFGPRVPQAQREVVNAMRPPWPQRVLMAWLLKVVLRPNHPSCLGAGDGLARWLLFVRSHWLRMPLHLLLPHLVRKAWMTRFPKSKPKAVVPNAQA